MNSVSLNRICKVSFQRPFALWMFVRTMKSVNTRKPKPMHIMRAKLMKVTEWKEKQNKQPPPLFCTRIDNKKTVEVEEPNLAVEFAAREFYQLLCSSKMVAIYHQNGIDMEMKTNLQLKLMKANIQIHIISNDAAKLGILDTRFANIHPLFVANNLYAVSEETNVKELLKATKRIPNLLLIGGLLEGQLMSSSDLEHFASLPSIDVMRSQLVASLSSNISTTSRYLQANQQALATNLTLLQSHEP